MSEEHSRPVLRLGLGLGLGVFVPEISSPPRCSLIVRLLSVSQDLHPGLPRGRGRQIVEGRGALCGHRWGKIKITETSVCLRTQA